MSISLESIVVKYLEAKKLSRGTRKEYRSTVTKWVSWENRVVHTDMKNISPESRIAGGDATEISCRNTA